MTFSTAHWPYVERISGDVTGVTGDITSHSPCSRGDVSLANVPLTLTNGDNFLSAQTIDLVNTVFISDGKMQPLFAFEASVITESCKASWQPSQNPSCPAQTWAFVAILCPCVHTYGDAIVSNSVFEERFLSRPPLQSVEGEDQSLWFSLAGDNPSFPGMDCTAPSGHRRSRYEILRPKKCLWLWLFRREGNFQRPRPFFGQPGGFPAPHRLGPNQRH